MHPGLEEGGVVVQEVGFLKQYDCSRMGKKSVKPVCASKTTDNYEIFVAQHVVGHTN